MGRGKESRRLLWLWERGERSPGIGSWSGILSRIWTRIGVIEPRFQECWHSCRPGEGRPPPGGQNVRASIAKVSTHGSFLVRGAGSGARSVRALSGAGIAGVLPFLLLFTGLAGLAFTLASGLLAGVLAALALFGERESLEFRKIHACQADDGFEVLLEIRNAVE